MIMPTHIVTGAGVVENDKNVQYLAYVISQNLTYKLVERYKGEFFYEIYLLSYMW